MEQDRPFDKDQGEYIIHCFPRAVQSDIMRTLSQKGILSLEDKAFELLTKMYSEFSGLKKGTKVIFHI